MVQRAARPAKSPLGNGPRGVPDGIPGHMLALAAGGAEATVHIRNTPNFMGGIGAFRLADRASARTVRVSAGSMTPSSQSRAVE